MHLCEQGDGNRRTVPLFIDMGIVHFYNCFSEKLKKNRFWKLKENSMS